MSSTGIAAAGGLSMTGTGAASSGYTGDSNLRDPIDATGAQLDEAVEATSPGSPLVGLGEVWIDVQNKRNINALYMAAHAALESNWGKSNIAQEKNNIYGFRAYDVCPGECADGYESFEQCVRQVMAYVDAEYLTPGGSYYEGTTLNAMNENYATDNQWSEKIASIMNDIAGNLPNDGDDGGEDGGNDDGGDGRFSMGDRITATTDLNTRKQPGTNSSVVTTVSPGTEGEIMNGPVSKEGYTWWGIHWLDDNTWGWSVERHLEPASGNGNDNPDDGGIGMDANITATTDLNTREQPDLCSPVVTTVSSGTEGKIVNGPVSKGDYTWWGVHWLDEDIRGWSVERHLKPVSEDGGDDGSGEDSDDTSNSDFVWPMSGTVSSPYGKRWGSLHSGVDITNDMGTPIYAARGGTAHTAQDPGGYGNYVYIVHENGYVTEYGHVSKFTVENGEEVTRGQPIAEMGNSGSSTGPHLHFTVERNNEPQPVPGEKSQSITGGKAVQKDYNGL